MKIKAKNLANNPATYMAAGAAIGLLLPIPGGAAIGTLAGLLAYGIQKGCSKLWSKYKLKKLITEIIAENTTLPMRECKLIAKELAKLIYNSGLTANTAGIAELIAAELEYYKATGEFIDLERLIIGGGYDLEPINQDLINLKQPGFLPLRESNGSELEASSQDQANDASNKEELTMSTKCKA